MASYTRAPLKLDQLSAGVKIDKNWNIFLWTNELTKNVPLTNALQSVSDSYYYIYNYNEGKYYFNPNERYASYNTKSYYKTKLINELKPGYKYGLYMAKGDTLQFQLNSGGARSDSQRDFYPELNIKYIDEVNQNELSQYIKNNEVFIMTHPSWGLTFGGDRIVDISQVSGSNTLHDLEFNKRLATQDSGKENLQAAYQMDAEKAALGYFKGGNRLLILVLPNYQDCRNAGKCDDAYYDAFINYLNGYASDNIIFIQSDEYDGGYISAIDIPKLSNLFSTLNVDTAFFMGGFVVGCEGNTMKDLSTLSEFSMIKHVKPLADMSTNRPSTFDGRKILQNTMTRIRNSGEAIADASGKRAFCERSNPFVPAIIEHTKQEISANYKYDKISVTTLLDPSLNEFYSHTTNYFSHYGCSTPDTMGMWHEWYDLLFTCADIGSEVKWVQTCCGGAGRVKDYSADSLEALDCKTPTSTKEYCVWVGDNICEPDRFSKPENMCTSTDCVDKEDLPDIEIKNVKFEIINKPFPYSYSSLTPLQCLLVTIVNSGNQNIVNDFYHTYHNIKDDKWWNKKVSLNGATILSGEEKNLEIVCFSEGAPNKPSSASQFRFYLDMYDPMHIRDNNYPSNDVIAEKNEDNNCLQGKWWDSQSFVQCPNLYKLGWNTVPQGWFGTPNNLCEPLAATSVKDCDNKIQSIHPNLASQLTITDCSRAVTETGFVFKEVYCDKFF